MVLMTSLDNQPFEHPLFNSGDGCFIINQKYLLMAHLKVGLGFYGAYILGITY